MQEKNVPVERARERTPLLVSPSEVRTKRVSLEDPPTRSFATNVRACLQRVSDPAAYSQ